MKSRHATVSVDETLAALEEEDEALIKSVVFRNSEGFVMKILKLRSNWFSFQWTCLDESGKHARWWKA
ncbi:hypothetical protein SESBI_26935 [Sesbania bispinosa]|nr:hypothetical protein SESBI_26935 [Sesbania bispinosa]